VFKILGETHKIIVNNLYDNMDDIYGVKLDRKTLAWWSTAPDFLPQFKIRRHYEKESLNYVVSEIVKLIFLGRHLDFDRELTPITQKYISKNIGIISHYLSDYVCLPHAKRWTFTNNMFKHISYETKLNSIAQNHDFRKNVITVDDIDIFEHRVIKLRKLIKKYIKDVIKEYSEKEQYENDLNFALSLSTKVSYFVIDTINAYNEENSKAYAFEF